MTATFPQAPLDLQADLQLAGTWTGVTHYALQRDGTSPPVTITRGRPDEAAQVNPAAAAWQMNNRDGRFSVKNPVGPYYGQLGRNTPVRLSVPAATTYLRFEADTVSYASAPDAARLDITGDTEFQIDMRLSDYQPCLLASKYHAGSNKSWALYLSAGGLLTLQYNDGSVVHADSSTLPVPLGRLAVKVTLQVSNGAGGHTVTFYTAASIAGPWTQLGSAVTSAGTSNVFVSTAPVVIGYVADFAADNPGSNGCLGAVYGFRLLSGIGGTVAAYADFTSQPAGATTWADAPGNTWTLAGTAEISGRDYRFHGEMSSLPVTWDESGKDVWVPVAAAGLLRRLGQGNAPLNSAMKRAILAQSGTLAVDAYWPCEDLAGAAAIGSAAGGPLMQVFGKPGFASDTSFLCSNALPQLNGSAWVGPVSAYASNGSIIVRFLMKLGAVPAGNPVLMRIITTGTCQELSLQVYNTAGLGIVGNASSGAAVFNSGGATFPNMPDPVWVSMELQPGGGGTVNYSLVTLVPGTSIGQTLSGSFSGTIGNATAVYVNPTAVFTDTVVGQISAQSAWQSLFGLYQPLNAWQGETAGSRFVRLCGENGIGARLYGFPATTVAMGAQSAQTLTQLLQECEDADRGQLYEARSALALGYRTQASMYNQAPAVTVNYAAAQAGGGPLEPHYDDQFTRNDVTVQRGSGNISGASYRFVLADGSSMSISPPPGGVGDYSDSKTVNVSSDAQLPDEASWLVHVGTVDQARWPAVPVDLTRTAVAGIFYQIIDADIGDYAAMINPPSQLPPDPVRQLVWGTREQLGGFHYQLEQNWVPESPYETGIFDDPVYGRADTDGSTLSAGINTTAVSFQVASTNTALPLWTTVAADFPFDIAIGGERMTVTNITGASSPQTFTVTRSVNGVVKTHNTGEDVRLWFPPVYAML